MKSYKVNTLRAGGKACCTRTLDRWTQWVNAYTLRRVCYIYTGTIAPYYNKFVIDGRFGERRLKCMYSTLVALGRVLNFASCTLLIYSFYFICGAVERG
jgi:hypothetical protein